MNDTSEKLELRHPVRSVLHEAHVLAEIEKAGDSPETPLLAIVGVMSVVLPIGAVMMVLAFTAAWLFG
ncbi:MAG TPA: hypothetical protein VH063_04705 [Gaiellaceae bacterium]|jgi:hypothetical protein|nr:hypothetical protein [Gaiellaceae bacterium]